MGQKQGSLRTDAGRLDGSLSTDITSAAFAFGDGFGTTPVLVIGTGSNDQCGNFTVEADATAAEATATITVTFSDGAYAAKPRAVLVSMSSTSAITDTGHAKVLSWTTTGFIIKQDVLPVDTKVYSYVYVVIQ